MFSSPLHRRIYIRSTIVVRICYSSRFLKQISPGKIQTGKEPDLSELAAAFWQLLFVIVVGRPRKECFKGRGKELLLLL